MYDEHAGVGRMLIHHVLEKDHALLGRRPGPRREMFLKSQRLSMFTA